MPAAVSIIVRVPPPVLPRLEATRRSRANSNRRCICDLVTVTPSLRDPSVGNYSNNKSKDGITKHPTNCSIDRVSSIEVGFFFPFVAPSIRSACCIQNWPLSPTTSSPCLYSTCHIPDLSLGHRKIIQAHGKKRVHCKIRTCDLEIIVIS